MTTLEINARFRGYSLALDEWEKLAEMAPKGRRALARLHRDLALKQAEEETPLIVIRDEKKRYHFPSASEKGKYYVIPNDLSFCPCRGFEVRKTCRHLAALKKSLDESASKRKYEKADSIS